MKNPLRKRLLRELRQDFGKYGALFLFMTVLVGFVSGFLVADNSLKIAYDESFEKYNVEDGHFTLLEEAKPKLLSALEQKGVTVQELWYKDKSIREDNTIRIYACREAVNRICIMDGKQPEQADEIAIDRLYAENNGLVIGDTLTVDDSVFTICGLAAFSDYSALFKNNTDMMFDANRFTVAVVTQEAWDDLDDSGLKYCYAWINQDRTLSDDEKNDLAEDLMETAAHNAILTDFVPREDNQAIVFTGDDMGSDKAMMTVILYIIMVLLAFSFSVTTRSTIEQESATIGTLLASGYTRGELLRHYLTLPVLVTLAAAVVGNILGYTEIKHRMADLYYHSYSLPTYVTVWNADAFLLTTVIPCLIVFGVNFAVLLRALSLPPMQFLRRELKRKKTKRVMRLPPLPFLSRFRIRIVLQNISAYVTIFIGIFMANVLLMFAMSLGPLLDHFKVDVLDSQFAAYQYILKGTDDSEQDEEEYSVYEMVSPFLAVFRQGAGILEIDDASYLLGFSAETENEHAEKYSVRSLLSEDGEDITVYGIQRDTAYLPDMTLPEQEGAVVASDGVLKKFGLKVGDELTLHQKYEDKTYTFRIADSYPYAAALTLFLPHDAFLTTFECSADSFSGYLSNEKLEDIDDQVIASVITQDDLTVLADQLNDSMGKMIPMVEGVAVLLYILVLYLLSKMIVEKNAQSISMLKILGYEDREVSGLYNRATAMVVFLSLVISLPLCTVVMYGCLLYMISVIHGWINFYIAPWIYPTMLASGIVCYAVVHWLQMRHIRNIPLSKALKTVE